MKLTKAIEIAKEHLLTCEEGSEEYEVIKVLIDASESTLEKDKIEES